MYERSYHSKVLKQDEAPTQHSPLPLRKIIIALAILVVLTGVVFLIRAHVLQLREVTVEGTHVAAPEDVSEYALQTREGYYLWVLPKASIFLTSTKVLEKKIQANFPRFKQVDVSRSSLHSLLVRVQEYPGVYLWCDDACSFMDETGVVFADAPYFSGTAYIKVYGGERAPYPFSPLTSAELSFAQALLSGLESTDINPSEIHFDNEHKVSVVFFHQGERAELYFDPANSADEAIDTLYTGLRTDPLMSMYRSTTHILHYIDLRFANKVVYKFD